MLTSIAWRPTQRLRCEQCCRKLAGYRRSKNEKKKKKNYGLELKLGERS